MAPRERSKPRRRDGERDRDRDRDRERERERRHARRKHQAAGTPRRPRPQPASQSSLSEPNSQALSADSLAKLNRINRYAARRDEYAARKPRRRQNREIINEKVVIERARKPHKRRKSRIVSGALLEEGEAAKLRGLRGGYVSEKRKHEDEDEVIRKKKKRICEFILIKSSN